MSDWPIDLSSMHSIHIGSPESNICGIIANQTPVSGTFSANRGLFVPFTLTRPVRVRKMWCINGTAVSGNLDIGIYDYALNKVVTSGSTAQAGVSSLQLVTIAATDLYPGLYFWAFAFDNAVATNLHPTLDVSVARILGVGQQVSAFPLPSTIVPVATSGTVPNLGMMTGRIV